MNVCDFFAVEKISLDIVEEITELKGSMYWSNCYEFLFDVWHKDVNTMTPAQMKWLTQILEDCVEYRIERKKK